MVRDSTPVPDTPGEPVDEMPSDEVIRTLNERGAEMADELLALLRPHTGEFGAVLSSLQLVLGRTTLPPDELLQALSALVRHNFGERADVAVKINTGQDAPPTVN